MDYDANIFGPRYNFIFHYVSGMHPQVIDTLEPWIPNDFQALQDITMQETFHGYYHNQFIFVNHFLLKCTFMVNWTFSFVLDEYIPNCSAYLPHQCLNLSIGMLVFMTNLIQPSHFDDFFLTSPSHRPHCRNLSLPCTFVSSLLSIMCTANSSNDSTSRLFVCSPSRCLTETLS